MKKTLILIISLCAGLNLAHANQSREMECVSQTFTGKLVTLKTCIQEYGNGYAEVVPCEGDSFEYVTITRETFVAKMTPPVTETVRIPGRLFDVKWVEDQISLYLNDPDAGRVNFVYTNPDLVRTQIFNLNLPSMQHRFKAVGCTFQ